MTHSSSSVDLEITPCGRGADSYACSGCDCGLETRQVRRLRVEVERLQAQLAAQTAVVEAARQCRCWLDLEEVSLLKADPPMSSLLTALARLDAADVPATQRKTRAQAFNDWFHGLSGGEPPGPDVGEAFRAGWDAAQAADVPAEGARRP